MPTLKLAKCQIDPAWRLRLSWAVAASLVSATPAAAAGSADPVVTIAILRDQDTRILVIGDRLARAGIGACSDRAYPPGLLLQTLVQYGADYRPAAAAMLGLGALPTVIAVDPAGAAAAVRVAPGDQVSALDGRPLPGGGPAPVQASYAATAAAIALMETALADGVADLTLLRGGRELVVTLRPAPGCRARFEVRPGRAQSATADGTIVQISSGLIAATVSDGELAAVLAHELAHNILRHPQRLRGKERGLKERDTETAADRLSVYLLDAAGFSPADAAGFWRRWGKARSLGIFADNSHPGWRIRAATIEAEAAAIAAQRAAGQPVVPPAALRP